MLGGSGGMPPQENFEFYFFVDDILNDFLIMKCISILHDL